MQFMHAHIIYACNVTDWLMRCGRYEYNHILSLKSHFSLIIIH